MAGGLSTLNFMQGAMDGYKFMEDRKDKSAARAQSLRMADLKEQEAGMLKEKWAAEKTKWESDAESRRADIDIKRGEADIAKQRLAHDKLKLESEEKRAGPKHEAEMAAIEARRLENETAAQKNKTEREKMELENRDRYVSEVGDYVAARRAGLAVARTEKQRAQMHAAGWVLPEDILSPDGLKARERIGKVLNGDIDMQDPEVSELIFFLNPDIKAAAKHEGEFEYIRMLPSPNNSTDPNEPKKVVFEVKIKGQNETKTLTHGRSTDPNESVIEVDLDAMTDKALALVQTQDLMQSEAGQEFLTQYGRSRSNKKSEKNAPKEELQTIGGMSFIVDTANGTMRQVDPGKTQDSIEQKERQALIQRLSTESTMLDFNRRIGWAKNDDERNRLVKQRDAYFEQMWQLSRNKNTQASNPPPRPAQVTPAPVTTSASEMGSSSGAPPPQAQPAPTQTPAADYKGDGTAPIQKLNPAQMSAFLAEKQLQPELTDREIIEQLRQRARNGR